MQHLKSIDVYTDGSFKKTKTHVYCGYGIYFPGKELKNVAAPFEIGEKTINRAELHAIYQAILRIKKNYTFDKINIYTDSNYSKESLTNWINNWKKNNWKNSAGKAVENQDIIKKIDKYMQLYHQKINIIWIPSHSNNKNNDEADRLAKLGASKSS